MFLADRAVGNRTYDYRYISSILKKPHLLFRRITFGDEGPVGLRKLIILPLDIVFGAPGRVGEMLPGMSYLVRRLLENTSNEGFLKQSVVDQKDIDELLKNPAEKVAA